MWTPLAMSIILFLLLVPEQDAPAPDSPPSKVVRISTEKQARKLAETAFLISTKKQISEYEITCFEKENKNQWKFAVLGSGKFLRPGYNWIVTVEKASGKTKVIGGE